MNQKDTIRIINETIADTNYIKDDRIPFYNLKKVLKNWIIVYMGSNIVILFAHIVARLLNLQFASWFFPTVRLLYFGLFLFLPVDFRPNQIIEFRDIFFCRFGISIHFH